MEIENSALYDDVQAVINSGEKPVHYTWTATIHAGDNDIEVLKVLERDTLMEFDVKYAAEMMITVQIGLGTYAYQVYPNQDKLDITLSRYPIGETGDTQNEDKPTEEIRYTAIFVDKGDIKLQGNSFMTPTQDALDLTSLVKLEFQLVDKTVEQLRMMTIGAKMRDVTIEDAVKAVMTSFSQKVKVDGAVQPKGVSMVPASNEKEFDHIIIPDGQRLALIPAYLQAHYGIYNAALGYFYQDGYWYLYPRYDFTRFDSSATSLTIINVPQNRFTGIERTYKKDGSHVTILATSEVRLEDKSNVMQLNAGNGVRYGDADKFMDGFGVTKDNKTTIARARNNSEYLTSSRDNGLNNVRFSDNKITANPFVEFSKMAERNGAYFTLRWENSDQSLIVPGMLAKITYLDGDDVKELRGSLLKVHHYDQMAGYGYVNTRYTSYSVLVFFVERSSDVEDE